MITDKSMFYSFFKNLGPVQADESETVLCLSEKQADNAGRLESG